MLLARSGAADDPGTELIPLARAAGFLASRATRSDASRAGAEPRGNRPPGGRVRHADPSQSAAAGARERGSRALSDPRRRHARDPLLQDARAEREAAGPERREDIARADRRRPGRRTRAGGAVAYAGRALCDGA